MFKQNKVGQSYNGMTTISHFMKIRIFWHMVQTQNKVPLVTALGSCYNEVRHTHLL